MNDSSLLNTQNIARLEQRVAELEAARARLMAKCEGLQQFYQQAPLAYQSLDSNGCLLEVNQRWLDTLGYGREEVIGKYFGAFLNKDDQEFFRVNFQKFKAAGEVYGVEFSLVKRDGTLIDVSFNGRIGKTAEGQFHRTHCFFQDITQRKHDETALRESEERFRALHNASFGGIVIHDHGFILDCNQGLSEQTGYSLEELIGMDGLELIAPQSRELVRLRIQQGVEQPYEAVGLRKDGSQYPLSIRGSNVPYKGRMVRVTEFRDITEYKRLEEALEKRLIALTCPSSGTEGVTFEDLFDLAQIQRIQDEFAAATGVASLITHPDGTPITHPSNFTRLCSSIIRKTDQGCTNCMKSDAALGRYHPGGPIIQPCLSGGLCDAGASITVGGHHVANWLIGQVRNEFQDEDAMRRYARAIGADEEDFIQAFYEVPSMSREQFERVAQALFTLANQLSTSAYQNIQQARAITERKKAEAALRVSEERFRMAMEATRDGLWDWDIASDTVYYSPGYWSMLGYDPETRQPTAASWKEMIHPEDQEGVLAANMDCIENRCETFQVEYRMQTREGSWKWIQRRGKVVARGKDGRALRMIGTHIDITERKHTEEEQETLKAQLLQAQKMESIARLAGGIAHDFNNMLMVIMGHADLALMRMSPDDPSSHRFQAIREIVERSADLTRQLLAFARKQPIAPKLLDLNSTIENMLAMLRRLIGEDITLTWLPGRGVWAVMADPSQIDQILANLCVNARDAIDGGGTIIVETNNCSFDATYCATHPGFVPGDYVRISVADNGCGMDQATLSKIFEPFFTTKGIGKGTGLGLATIYGIVRQNNGFVDVFSKPGQGTVFTVYLPKVEGDADIRETQQGDLVRGGTETILVVEDEQAILEMATNMLQHLGYTVFAASTPSEALRISSMHGDKIDLLMTDVIMPEMNGLELAQRLLTSQPWIKCLFMSGYTADIIARKGVLEDGIHFIQKPFSHITLAAKVREALEEE
jgi:PAS domain S-box-containing protein